MSFATDESLVKRLSGQTFYNPFTVGSYRVLVRITRSAAAMFGLEFRQIATASGLVDAHAGRVIVDSDPHDTTWGTWVDLAG